MLLISNIASSAKIIDWGVSVAGLPLAFDAGTLLFPISYIFGDILTEVYGYAAGRRVIWAGFAMSALMGLTLWVVARLPGEANWQATAGQAAYDAILGGVSYGGIIVASLAAYFAGEFSNSFVLAKLKIATSGRFLWVRTIGSTLVGRGRRLDRLRVDCERIRRLSMGRRRQHHRRELHLQGDRSRCSSRPSRTGSSTS